MRAKNKLVVVGNGMAGLRMLEDLLELAPDRYDITVFGAEPYGNYNRILLSPLLAGEKNLGEIMIHDEPWYRGHGITLCKGRKIMRIDRRARRVIAADGSDRCYDDLVLATGSNPLVLPVPGVDLPGVVTFRDIHDVEAMLAAAAEYQNATVIGGGLLGLEAAQGLLTRGMKVSVVHRFATLMERQLDTPAAGLLRQSLEQRGLRFLMEKQTAAILGDRRVTGLRFSDGTEIATDFVVMAAGITPNAGLARDAGLDCERGVVVNDAMQTSDPRIYAVGECAQHRGRSYGLLAPLYEQARVCAAHLAGAPCPPYRDSIACTSLKVTGIDLYSGGLIHADTGCDAITLLDEGAGIYKKLVLRDARLVGAVLYGATDGAGWYTRLLNEPIDITPYRDELMFGAASGGIHSGKMAA